MLLSKEIGLRGQILWVERREGKDDLTINAYDVNDEQSSVIYQ